MYLFRSDFEILDTFFNYANYTVYNNFLNFNLELLLSGYILYNIIFFTNNKIDYKNFYYRYIFFIIILFFLCVVNIILGSNNIVFCNLLATNEYILTNKLFIIISLILILFIIKNKILKNPSIISLNELPIIFSFLLLFIFILLSTFDFFLIYLTIEGISLILYSLGSLMNESLINLESVIKYFLINNLASSLLLWSLSYIYIFAGTTDGFEIKYILTSFLESASCYNLHYICLLFIISILIKLAIFPFQWWIADVFEGFWTPIILIYAVIIKYTYFILLFKLLTNIFSSIMYFISPFLWIAASGSVIIGSIGALTQVKIKRFLAYTSISQSGYILIGLGCNSVNGFLSAYLYLIMYCIITIAFFCIFLNIEHITKGNNIIYFNQLQSLFIFNKEISIHAIIIIFVMAAIPPFTSFFAKLFIFLVTVESKLEIITCIFLFFSLISTFYYLNFIQQLIFYKLQDYKIYFYKESIVLNIFLKINSSFFIIGVLFIIYIYEYAFRILLLGIYFFSI